MKNVEYICDVCGKKIMPAVDGGGFLIKKSLEVERVYARTDTDCRVTICAKCAEVSIRQINKLCENY